MTGELPINGEEVFLTASLGIAVGGSGDTAEGLLRDADAAMYSAKDRGRARVELFDHKVGEAFGDGHGRIVDRRSPRPLGR